MAPLSPRAAVRELLTAWRRSGWRETGGAAFGIVEALQRDGGQRSRAAIAAAIPERFVVVNATTRAHVAEAAELALHAGVETKVERHNAASGDHASTSILGAMSASRRPKVIVLTALPLEYKAAREHLCDVRAYDRERNWEIGRFRTNAGDEVDVLLIETGPENARAAAVTSAALENFRPIAAIYTGVAGGLGKKGVKPGEVVVPPHVYHYGTGKGDTELREFGQRPRGRNATKRMRLAAQRVDRQNSWRERVKGEAAQQSPRARLEPMASGDIVVKSKTSDVYRLLRLIYEDAVAIDMESGGFLASVDEFPDVEGAVVRGVSDLLDDKNPEADEERQPRAAAYAAAFTFALIDEAVTSITKGGPVADEITRSAELELGTVDELAGRAGFRTWTADTEFLFQGWPSVRDAYLAQLHALQVWLASRAWIDPDSPLARAVKNFERVLTDFHAVLLEDLEIVHGNVVRLCKSYRNERPGRDRVAAVEAFKRRVKLVENLAAELTRAGNLVLARARELDPTFHVEDGNLVILAGPDEAMGVMPRYSEEEASLGVPYPGLDTFESVLPGRDGDFGMTKSADDDPVMEGTYKNADPIP
jgi:nucleoside phosphorylase